MKISKFIYAAVVGGVLASCQSVDTPMFSDKDAFVAFDSKSTSIAENAGSEVKIPVSLVASKGSTCRWVLKSIRLPMPVKTLRKRA